jgi:hypothetical protein
MNAQVQALSSELSKKLGLNSKTDLTNGKVKDDNSIVVNTLFTNNFSKQNLSKLEQLVQVEAWPELYGDQLPDGIKFTGFDLMDISVLDQAIKGSLGNQVARASENPEFDNIKNDILTNGYKLRYPPIAVAEYENGSIDIITGKTRTKILKNNCKFTNAIVAKYKVFSKRTLLTQSIRFNCIDVPSGTAKAGDVLGVASELISEGSLKRNINAIREWITEAVGNGPFTDNYKEHLAVTILNNASVRPQIYSWRPENIAEWMNDHGFLKASEQYPAAGISGSVSVYVDKKNKKSTNDFLYMVCASSSFTKNLYRAAELMSNSHFIGKTLRVLVHTSTLPDSTNTKDLKEVFEQRIKNHNTEWKNMLRNYSEVFYDDAKVKTNVVLYGALPAIKQIHNMDEIVVF